MGVDRRAERCREVHAAPVPHGCGAGPGIRAGPGPALRVDRPPGASAARGARAAVADHPGGDARRGLRAPRADPAHPAAGGGRSEEHTSELQSLMRISYAVFCLKKKKKKTNNKQLQALM